MNRWARLNRRHRREVDGQPAPSRNDEYLFYQTLVGVWPLTPPHGRELREFSARIAAYMEKATHEAKVHTSRINPDVEYDAAVRGFVAAALDDQPKNRFLADLRHFHEQIVDWGLYTALSQPLLKLTSPGVPDIYQGQELWDFSLVDPDNRRPVDFAQRRKMLAPVWSGLPAATSGRCSLSPAACPGPARPAAQTVRHLRESSSSAANMPAFSGSETTSPWRSAARGQSTLCLSRGKARRLGDGEEIAIVIAPRLIAELTPCAATRQTPPPLGSAVWENPRSVVENLRHAAEEPIHGPGGFRVETVAYSCGDGAG